MKTLLIALYPYNGQLLDAWLDHGAGMTFTAAQEAGCEVDFLDMKALANDAELKKAIKGYDLIAFGLKSSYYAIAMKIIGMAWEQKSKVMVGGYHATAAPKELLENKDIDWVFHGESEITFPEFLKNPERFNREIWGEKPQNLSTLPFMDRTMYREPIENCDGWWHGGVHKRMVSVMAARGCAYNCAFCQPLERDHFGAKIRRRSVDSLIAELEGLRDLYDPDCVMIHDDTFLFQPKWIEEFIEKYPKIGLPFWAAGRADGICDHPDLVKGLVKVGWELVSVGFESGSQRILDLIKKGTTVEQNLESARIIKENGAKIYANYMIGLPWETKEDIQATARMADEINAEMPSWAYFTPYPGCELGEQCIKEGLSLLDRNNYDRRPSGKKVKNVDYEYIEKVMGGLRDVTPVTVAVTNRDKITAITCTGGRPETFKLCQRWMMEQTVRPDQWIIVDDGKESLMKSNGQFPSYSKYIRREPHLNDPQHTMLLNLKEAIPHIEGDVILFFEDDEYYAPGYIEEMVKWLDKYEVVGIAPSRYYHLFSGRYMDSGNMHHASLAQTGFNKSFLPEFEKMLVGNQYVDYRLWDNIKDPKRKFLFSDAKPLYVAMKGMPGRPGIGNGHRNFGELNPDSPDMATLKKWIPNQDHFNVYFNMSKANKIEGESVFMGKYRAKRRGHIPHLGIVEAGQIFEFDGPPGSWMVPVMEGMTQFREQGGPAELNTMSEMTKAFAENKGIIPPPSRMRSNIPKMGESTPFVPVPQVAAKGRPGRPRK